MADLVDIRLHQHALAHEIYRQQILQRLPDPYPNMLPPRHVAMPRMLQGVDAKLQNSELWKQFHQIGTEMIITKSGRRMFPSLRLALAGLEDDVNYCVLLEMVPVGDCRYKFSGSQWVPAGGAEPQSPQRMYLHQDSPALGSHWTAQPIIFNKVKLTNNTLDNSGHIVLTSMHKYQPRLHIVRASDPSQIPWSAQKGFTFPETEFVAVTAYQNDRITKLKIDNNPFAKGFRETGQSRCKRKQLSNSPKTEENQEIEIGIKRMRPDSSACSISSLDDSGRSTSESSSGTSSPDNISRKHQELQQQLQYSTHFSNPSWMDLAFSYLTRPYTYFPPPTQGYEFLPSFGTSVPSYPPVMPSHQQISPNHFERSEIPQDEKSVDLTIKPPKKCSFSISAILGCDR